MKLYTFKVEEEGDGFIQFQEESGGVEVTTWNTVKLTTIVRVEAESEEEARRRAEERLDEAKPFNVACGELELVSVEEVEG